MDVVKENMSVILKRENVLKAATLERGKKVIFEKLHFKPDEALGKPFGSCYEVVSGGLKAVGTSASLSSDKQCDVESTEAEVKCVEDNRSLLDMHGKSQSLKREEIVSMKASGAKGSDIVEEIVKNSASFHGKTIYSQKKYLKKKKMKHVAHIRIVKPSARLLCKMYESREPAKICHMRLDTISQIIVTANVHHGSKVAVVETCSGLLLGLAMERLGGEGAVVNLHSGDTPTNFHAITHFNFPEQYWSKLHSLPLGKIGYLHADKTFEQAFGEIPIDTDTGSIDGKTPASSDVPKGHCEEGRVENGSPVVGNIMPPKKKDGRRELTDEEKCQIRAERRRKKLRHQQNAWDLLQARAMDTLIVACKFHPTPLVLALLEFVAPCRPFVVYCETREPLVELFIQLSIMAKAVNVKITETFARRYQVLPEQTHPFVMMSPSSGFLLSGITVQSERKTKDT